MSLLGNATRRRRMLRKAERIDRLPDGLTLLALREIRDELKARPPA